MGFDVTTKDCTALDDTELEAFADMCVDGPAKFDIGTLSKQRELWVLVTTVREGNKLHGFSFSTLERIGGTPCVLVGLASVRRTAKRDQVLRALVHEEERRAWLAFPDEDVLVGARFGNAGAFLAYKALSDIVPRPDHRPTGEERAWSRRLAKRFGLERNIDDRTFILRGDGSRPGVLDFETSKPEKLDPAVVAYFDALDDDRGDSLVAFGWATAEELQVIGSPSRKMV